MGRAPPETSGGTILYYPEVNFDEDLNGAPLVNYADSQSEMEEGKARHDVVKAAARALAEAVAKIYLLWFKTEIARNCLFVIKFKKTRFTIKSSGPLTLVYWSAFPIN
jgi:hypothetical protein